jgi:hypothetical protein
MANACIVVDNQAVSGTVGASSQALTMPASNLLTPHPSERWRSLSNFAYFVLDKGAMIEADTIMLAGLTCGPNASVRLRLSTIDATGLAGDVLDTGNIVNGDAHFDVDYSSFVYQLPAPAAWRYARIGISDPDSSYVEAGCILDGLSQAFTYNFAPGGGFQLFDRSRVTKSASGMTLTWNDNSYRQLNLTFNAITSAERYGVVERLDRVAGKTHNVLLISDPASGNLPRDSIFGLVTNQTLVSFNQAYDNSGNLLFGKQFQIEERI